MTESIAAEIQAEQKRGRNKYGNGPDDLAHDDSHSPKEWHEFIRAHERKAETGGRDRAQRRKALIKLAGLVVSAIESHDRTFYL